MRSGEIGRKGSETGKSKLEMIFSANKLFCKRNRDTGQLNGDVGVKKCFCRVFCFCFPLLLKVGEI